MYIRLNDFYLTASFVQELRDELTKRGLDSSGLKAALAERLEESIKAETDGAADAGAQAPVAAAAELAAQPAAAPAPAANGEAVSLWPLLHTLPSSGCMKLRLQLS